MKQSDSAATVATVTDAAIAAGTAVTDSVGNSGSSYGQLKSASTGDLKKFPKRDTLVAASNQSKMDLFVTRLENVSDIHDSSVEKRGSSTGMDASSSNLTGNESLAALDSSDVLNSFVTQNDSLTSEDASVIPSSSITRNENLTTADTSDIPRLFATGSENLAKTDVADTQSDALSKMVTTVTAADGQNFISDAVTQSDVGPNTMSPVIVDNNQYPDDLIKQSGIAAKVEYSVGNDHSCINHDVTWNGNLSSLDSAVTPCDHMSKSDLSVTASDDTSSPRQADSNSQPTQEADGFLKIDSCFSLTDSEFDTPDKFESMSRASPLLKIDSVFTLSDSSSAAIDCSEAQLNSRITDTENFTVSLSDTSQKDSVVSAGVGDSSSKVDSNVDYTGDKTLVDIVKYSVVAEGSKTENDSSVKLSAVTNDSRSKMKVSEVTVDSSSKTDLSSHINDDRAETDDTGSKTKVSSVTTGVRSKTELSIVTDDGESTIEVYINESESDTDVSSDADTEELETKSYTRTNARASKVDIPTAPNDNGSTMDVSGDKNYNGSEKCPEISTIANDSGSETDVSYDASDTRAITGVSTDVTDGGSVVDKNGNGSERCPNVFSVTDDRSGSETDVSYAINDTSLREVNSSIIQNDKLSNVDSAVTNLPASSCNKLSEALIDSQLKVVSSPVNMNQEMEICKEADDSTLRTDAKSKMDISVCVDDSQSKPESTSIAQSEFDSRFMLNDTKEKTDVTTIESEGGLKTYVSSETNDTGSTMDVSAITDMSTAINSCRTGTEWCSVTVEGKTKSDVSTIASDSLLETFVSISTADTGLKTGVFVNTNDEGLKPDVPAAGNESGSEMDVVDDTNAAVIPNDSGLESHVTLDDIHSEVETPITPSDGTSQMNLPAISNDSSNELTSELQSGSLIPHSSQPVDKEPQFSVSTSANKSTFSKQQVESEPLQVIWIDDDDDDDEEEDEEDDGYSGAAGGGGGVGNSGPGYNGNDGSVSATGHDSYSELAELTARKRQCSQRVSYAELSLSEDSDDGAGGKRSMESRPRHTVELTSSTRSSRQKVPRMRHVLCLFAFLFLVDFEN